MPGSWWYTVIDVALIYFFSYFWTSLMFNPAEMSKNMKESGSFIPGIRPGRNTAEFLDRVMVHMTLAGATFLAVIAIVPDWLARQATRTGISHFLGGTSILIVVCVALDLVDKLNGHLMMRNYEGFLRGGGAADGRRGYADRPPRAPGMREGHAGRAPRGAGGDPPPLDRRPPAGGRGRGDRAREQAKPLMDAGRLVPDAVVIGLVRSGSRARRREGVPPRRLPPHDRPGRRARRGGGGEGHRARRLLRPRRRDDRESSLGRGRSDDTEPVVRKRLEVYRAQTEPLVARYRKAGLLREVDASGTIDQVEAGVKKALEAPRAVSGARP